MELTSLPIIAAFILLAVVSQLLSGFGFAIVLIPLLMLVIEPAEAVVLANLLGTALSVVLLVQDRRYADYRKALHLLGWGALGLPIGIVALSWLSASVLKWVIIVVVFVALAVVAANVSLKNNRLSTTLVGLLSGALLTSTGMNGPPLVALVRANNYSVRQYRATLAAVFSAQGSLGILMLAGSGKIGLNTLGLASLGLLAIPAGFMIGNRLFKHIDAHRLRVGITFMLMLSIVSVVMR